MSNFAKHIENRKRIFDRFMELTEELPAGEAYEAIADEERMRARRVHRLVNEHITRTGEGIDL